MKCCHLVILVKKWRVHPSGFQTSTRFVIESKNESCTYSLTGEELSKSVWSTAIGEHKAKQDLFSLACQPIHSFSYKVNRVRKLIFCKLAHIHIVYIEVIGLETNVWKAKGNSESSKICLMTNLWESLDPILAPTSVNWYLMKKNRMRTMRSKNERLKVIVTLLFVCHFGQNNNTCDLREERLKEGTLYGSSICSLFYSVHFLCKWHH